MTVTRISLTELAERSFFGRIRVPWSEFPTPGTVVVTLDGIPLDDRRVRGRMLGVAARAWGRDHGYRVRTESAPEWSAVAITFTEKEQGQ